jgi:hypothetical protein
MATSPWCIDDICRQAPRAFDTRVKIIFGGSAVRNRMFAYQGHHFKRVLIEASIGSLGLRRPSRRRRRPCAYEKLAAGMTPDWQVHDCRVTLRAMKRFGMVPGNESRTMFGILLDHLLRCCCAFAKGGRRERAAE